MHPRRVKDPRQSRLAKGLPGRIGIRSVCTVSLSESFPRPPLQRLVQAARKEGTQVLTQRDPSDEPLVRLRVHSKCFTVSLLCGNVGGKKRGKAVVQAHQLRKRLCRDVAPSPKRAALWRHYEMDKRNPNNIYTFYTSSKHSACAKKQRVL